MHAITLLGHGGPENIVADTRPIPTPNAGEVLIRVVASGMNRADLLQCRGLYPPPAGTSDLMGLEVAGHVEALGPDTTGFKVGDAVCALLPGGGYAAYATIAASLCAPVPDSISMIEAAALPEGLFTVWNMLFLRGNLKAGHRVLIHGGTSGIGTLAIQMAHAFGATVFATVGSAEKREICQRLGATDAFVRGQDSLEPLDNSIDIVLTMAGGETLEADTRALQLDGRHLSIAYVGGAVGQLQIPTLMSKRLLVTGATLRGRPLPELATINQDLLTYAWPLVAARRIKPVIHATYPLAAARTAHEAFARSEHIGKIVLTL